MLPIRWFKGSGDLMRLSKASILLLLSVAPTSSQKVVELHTRVFGPVDGAG
jgi:hypothetical protein